MLLDFVGNLERGGARRITVDTALAWATEPRHADPVWWAKRLTVVRGFARYLSTLDEDSEVPPADLLPGKVHRSTPYLYSPAQIAALMGAARRLASPLRAATFEAFIGLMAVTGLRTGEAMNLDRADVDLAEGMLMVRNSKFGKSRHIPLHPTTTVALGRYARRRDELCLRPAALSFFLSGAGTGSTTPTRARPSPACSASPASLRHPAGAGLGSTTCATASPWPLSSPGTKTTSTCQHGCRRCPLTWATPRRRRPTGTSKRLPS